jgi:RNA polymerase sigma factor for flagellar operon FliA
MMEEAQEQQLWRAVEQDRNAPERLLLIEKYTYLARINAVHYYRIRSGDDIEFNDYLQFAMVGLLEAVQRYEPDKGASFATFATYRIKGSLLNGLEKATELRDQTAFFRRSQRMRVKSIVSNIDHNENANFTELVNVTIELALSFMLEDAGFLQNEEEVGDELYVSEVKRTLSIHLGELVDKLPERERLIIRNHYYHAMAFDDLAKLFDISKGRVSQLHKQALKLIKLAYESSQELDTKL